MKVAIVGGGLAGSTLAWQCLRLGATVAVTDRGDPHSASRVAAGLITPLTGHRLAVSWNLDGFYPAARALYRSVESETNTTFLDETVTLRLYRSVDEAHYVEARLKQFRPYLVDQPVPDWAVAPAGAVGLAPSARLDVPEFLHATARRLADNYRAGEADPTAAGDADWVVSCQGFAADPTPLGGDFRATKGEVLTVRLPQGLGETRTLNQNGTWLTPLGGELFLAGSTYDHADLTPTPTAAGRDDILARLAQFVRGPIEVTGHRAGVRPILYASRPVIGCDPRTRRAWFNGLGSKGALTAPEFARRLARRLVLGEPLGE